MTNAGFIPIRNFLKSAYLKRRKLGIGKDMTKQDKQPTSL
jgi:hypothetical protein